MPAVLLFVPLLAIAPAVSLIVRRIPGPLLLAALSVGLCLPALTHIGKLRRRS